MIPIIQRLLFTLSTLFTITTTLALPTTSTTKAQDNVPLNGLPAPSSTWTLKHITLGIGTQNYTCSAASAAPVSNGAVATLYNANLLSSPSNANLIPSFAAVAYSTHTSLGLQKIGAHWFSADSVPSFQLDDGSFLSAKKVADVKAPESCIEGSVDWLLLEDDGRGVSKGVSAVYRVETAGGAAPAVCDKEGNIEVRYAAEYWFYG